MINNHGWLLLEDGDVIQLSIHVPSIEEVVKHWIDNKGRSFLCTGKDCLSCKDGVAKRFRYVSSVIVKGEAMRWEFGEDLNRSICKLPQLEGFAKFVVIRQGTGRHTRYLVRESSEHDPLRLSKFNTGKYGHLIQF